MWDKIASHISQVTGENFEILDRRSVGGGCINQGYRLSGEKQNYFVKLNRASELEMFEAEAIGVRQMWESQTIRVPQPICTGTAGNSAYIVLEWIDIGDRGNTESAKEMGRKLAQLHRNAIADKFGWDRNNTIGTTPQINTWTADWAEFWGKNRIGYQLQLAKRRGGDFPKGQRLLEAIPKLISGREPEPSLVHGDLWSGNASFTPDGEPVIFDPATYYGDREVDIAMTELFGGFSPAFYRGYNEVWPLDSGYDRRKILYNLYHVINHFNLFGGGYGSQANRMIEQLL